MRTDDPPTPRRPRRPRCDEPPGPVRRYTAAPDGDDPVPAVEAALLLLKDGRVVAWTDPADSSGSRRTAPRGVERWARTAAQDPTAADGDDDTDALPPAGDGSVRLPRPYRRLVQCLAVLGHEVPLQRLAELVDDPEELGCAVEAAARAGLLVWHPGAGRASVARPTRLLVVATMTASETGFAHRWAARHAQGAAALLHRAAAAARPDEELAGQLESEARRLAVCGRYRRAAELARRAADVSACGARAAHRTADSAEFALRAHDLAQARRALAPTGPDTASPWHRALAGRLAVLEGRIAEGAARLGEACRELRLADGAAAAGLEAAVVWTVEARLLVGAPVTDLRHRITRRAAPGRGAAYWESERRCLDAVLTALAEGPAAGLAVLAAGAPTSLHRTAESRGRAAVTEAWLRLESGDPAGGEAAVRVALRAAASGPDDHLRDAALTVRGHARWLSGAWEAAEACGHAVARSGSPLWRARGRELLDLLAAGRGDAEPREAADGETVDGETVDNEAADGEVLDGEAVERSVPGAVARLFHALVAEAFAGRPQAAALLADPDHRLGLDLLSGPLLPWRKADLVHTAVTAGDGARAAALLDSLRAETSGLPPWLRACAAWAEARATALTGSREATALHYARADESAADFEATAPWYYARYQADHAAFLAAAGHRRDAVDRYRAAWTVAGRVGAEPLRARCAAGLRALRMPERAHPFALTARETEVARLVSGGLTNRETAARLFVTPASVGFHLGNIYGKLGIRSRYELREWWSHRDDT